MYSRFISITLLIIFISNVSSGQKLVPYLKGNYGIQNDSGELITECKYLDARYGEKGLALLKDEEGWKPILSKWQYSTEVK